MEQGSSKCTSNFGKLLALAILGSMAAVLAINGLPDAKTWTATHWLFTYEHGFIKRGLIGTLLAQFSETVSIRTVSILYFGIVALAAMTLALLIWHTIVQAVVTTKARLATTLLACFLATSPGALQQWLADIGRFDVFAFVLLCLSFVVALRTSGALTGLVAVSLCSTLAILVHEGFFFWVGPMGVTFWMWRHDMTRRNFVFGASALTFLTCVAALVSTSGYGDRFEFQDARPDLQSRAEFNINDNSLMVHYRNLAENISYTKERAWTSERLPGQALGVLYLVFWAFVLVRFFAGNWDFRTVSLVIACFVPLGLVPLGHDLGRWFAMINCNLLLATLLMISSNPMRLGRLATYIPAILTLGLALNIFLGPFGVTLVFPEPLLFRY